MEVDAASKPFDLYYRAENPTTRAVPGLGLGLNIAQTIIQMHDRQISIESEPGRGTRIEFEIPRVVDGAHQAA